MVRFEGQSMQATTIPGKPTPTGFKVWGIAQRGFLLIWNYHAPGKGGGPLDTPCPPELGGHPRTGKGGNKTQAVALKLLERLPKKSYHLWMDNLFISERFLELLRKRGFGGIGTCRTNSGVIQELLDIKAGDKNDTIPWGTIVSKPTKSGNICQTGWKDNAFVLIQSNVLDGEGAIERKRKRPKETSSKAKTSRKKFGKHATKVLEILLLYDKYNYNMGAVDQHDNLATRNPGLRPIRRGGHQAIEHWDLRVVLVNCYLLSLLSDFDNLRPIDFSLQSDFRTQLVEALFSKAHQCQITPKRRI